MKPRSRWSRRGATVPPSPTPPEQATRRRRVTSHVTSRPPKLPGKVLEFPKEGGAPSMIRTCDLLVRRLMQVPRLAGSSCL